MRGQRFETADFEQQIVDVRPSDLLDLSTGRLAKPFQWQDTFNAAVASKDDDAIEWLRDED